MKTTLDPFSSHIDGPTGIYIWNFTKTKAKLHQNKTKLSPLAFLTHLPSDKLLSQETESTSLCLDPYTLTVPCLGGMPPQF